MYKDFVQSRKCQNQLSVSSAHASHESRVSLSLCLILLRQWFDWRPMISDDIIAIDVKINLFNKYSFVWAPQVAPIQHAAWADCHWCVYLWHGQPSSLCTWIISLRIKYIFNFNFMYGHLVRISQRYSDHGILPTQTKNNNSILILFFSIHSK